MRYVKDDADVVEQRTIKMNTMMEENRGWQYSHRTV